MTVLDDIAALRARLEELERAEPTPAGETQRRRLLGRLGRARGDLTGDPQTSHPALLLPVRLETRFAWRDAGAPGGRSVVRPATALATPLLLIRVYPDDIHVDGHDPALTEEELGWQADYLRSAAAGRERADHVTAWEALVARAGPTRAAWIVAQRPPAAPVRGERMTRPARARLLPDRFVAHVTTAGAHLRGDGALVREPLDVTPDPWRGGGGELAWMVDFDEAVRAGLALVVELPPTSGGPPEVERLVVTGTHVSRGPVASAAALAGLFDAHHYTRGLAFARPGAATNAIQGERPDRTSRPTVEDVFAVEGDMAPLTPPTTLVDDPPADGLDAAALLGVDAAVFGHVRGADGRWRQAGQDLRRVLASAFLPTLTHLLDPVVRADALAEAAEFYVASVDPLGPLPVLAVGEQPYGLLPVSRLAPTDPDLSDRERRLLTTLDALRATVWEPATGRVSRIGGPPADPTATLLAILRQDGAATDAWVRPALGPEATAALVSTYDPPRVKIVNDVRERIGELLAALGTAPAVPPIAELTLTEALPVMLPFVGDAPEAYLDELSLYPPLPRTLLEIAYGLPAAADLLHALSRLGLLAAADRACRMILRDAGVADAGTVAAWDRERDDGSVALYRLVDRLNTLLPSEPGTPLHALLTGDSPPAGAEPFLGTRAAIRSLAVPPSGRPGRPQRHPVALLDTLLRSELGGLTNRLDAWYTALTTERLRRLRATPGGGAGLVVGAYGILLDIAPNPQPTAVPAGELPAGTGPVVRVPGGGWVHAPSVGQAVTAGVLRSAHLAQWRLGTGAGRDAFSVDLSSRRVRTALAIMDGIREGQPLAALLGYRIERRMRADAPAGIAVLRRAAPLVAGKLTPGGPVEQVAADNVVDALALFESVGDGSGDRIRAALAPFRGGVTDADWRRVLVAARAAIADARNALDAVADVLVAEGVFQLVQGNPERSGAAGDAIAGAGTPPPVPAVIDTVRGGTAVVHRIAVLLPADGPVPADDPAGWALTPRGRLEPALERWARTLLPAPGALVPLRLAALDVVAATPEQLAARAATAGTAPDEDLVTAAAALRTLLVEARALTGADLTAAAAPPAAADETGAAARLTAFAGAVTAAHAGLDAALAADPRDPAALAAALLAADLVGTALPVPAGTDLVELVPAAVTARGELAARLAADDAARPVAERAGALSGGTAWVLPAVTPPADPPPDGVSADEVTRYLARAGAVRAGVARLDRVVAVAEALTAAVPVFAVAQQPAGGRWAASGGGTVPGGRTSLVSYLPFPVGASVTGLLVDEWTDTVPDTTVTTSMAFHYDAPSSAAPNVALLGVAPPGAERWTPDELLAVVTEALALTRLRAVDTDALAGAGPLVPPLYSVEHNDTGVSAGLDVLPLTEPS